jgi:hypothetical protein
MFTIKNNIRRMATEPRRENSFMRVWVKSESAKAAYPIIFIAACGLSFGVYFFIHTLKGPEIHVNKQERKTLDYLENDRDVKKAEKWASSTLHRGPEIIKSSKHDDHDVPSTKK